MFNVSLCIPSFVLFVSFTIWVFISRLWKIKHLPSSWKRNYARIHNMNLVPYISFSSTSADATENMKRKTNPKTGRIWLAYSFHKQFNKLFRFGNSRNRKPCFIYYTYQGHTSLVTFDKTFIFFISNEPTFQMLFLVRNQFKKLVSKNTELYCIKKINRELF